MLLTCREAAASRGCFECLLRVTFACGCSMGEKGIRGERDHRCGDVARDRFGSRCSGDRIGCSRPARRRKNSAAMPRLNRSPYASGARFCVTRRCGGGFQAGGIATLAGGLPRDSKSVRRSHKRDEPGVHDARQGGFAACGARGAISPARSVGKPEFFQSGTVANGVFLRVHWEMGTEHRIGRVRF